MIRDLSQTTGTSLPEYDVCIVGSGPAGATVARELCGVGLSICVLESGGLRTSRHGDRLREVRSEGIVIKEYSRERVLGGASTTWAGLSSPLDEIDLRPRPFLRRSGWPIGREELLPWWSAAARYRFASLEAFGAEGFLRLRERGDLRPRWREVEDKVFLAAARAQDFGRECRFVYEQDEADLHLDATVLRLEAAPGTRRVAAALLRTRDGRELRLRARVFVLATGGIENARLLLNSTDLCAAGLGNEHDQVGRCLMNHPKDYHGLLRLARPVRELPFYFGCLNEGYAGYAGLRLTEAVQREREVLNAYVRLEPLFPWSDDAGVESVILLAKRSKVLLQAFQARRAGKVVQLRDYAETGDDSRLQNERKSALDWARLALRIPLHAVPVARYLRSRLFEKAGPLVKTVRLRNFMEMEPDPENRVTLAVERDVYGQPLPLVRHRCTSLDRRSLVELHRSLREEFRREGVGELDSDLEGADPWPVNEDASHHMGTTRMGDDPQSSVTNRDARLHGAENVYVSGASLFPTSGCANPTFTIVALAMRLAAHLREVVFRRSGISSRPTGEEPGAAVTEESTWNENES